MPETAATSETETATAETATDAGTTTTTDGKPASAGDLSATERAELERLRAVHEDEKKWEKRSKQNFADAEKFRNLAKALAGDDKPDEFDPRAEFEKLRGEITTERTERLRADVARVKGVDPAYVTGSTSEEMTAAADRYLADVQARVEAALKGAKSSATESTSTVKGGDRVEGPKQIETEAELKKLSPKEQMQALRDGRLNKLLGRPV